MEPITLAQVAEQVAFLGAIGVVTAVLNAVALRLVCVEDVPGWLRVRVRWWRAHNLAFLLLSAATAGAGLAMLAAGVG
jgi:hypothetical protein